MRENGRFKGYLLRQHARNEKTDDDIQDIIKF